MLIQYKDWNPTKSSLDVVRKANEILAEFDEHGFDLTLRQLYYQFVSRDLIPNTEKSYKRLGDIISNARDAGMIDWSKIKDRGRSLYGKTHYESGEEFLTVMANRFYCDWWEGQEVRVQVWVEKEALSNVVGRAASAWDVDYFPCKGYMSSSAIWEMGREMLQSGVDEWVILHLGDHDPSGMDMTRDNIDRVSLYSRQAEGDCNDTPNIRMHRIALNMDQVVEYDPPPNPAKSTDKRYKKYKEEYGESSWELDALHPQVIMDLISKNIEALITDKALFEKQKKKQTRIRNKLQTIEFD